MALRGEVREDRFDTGRFQASAESISIEQATMIGDFTLRALATSRMIATSLVQSEMTLESGSHWLVSSGLEMNVSRLFIDGVVQVKDTIAAELDRRGSIEIGVEGQLTVADNDSVSVRNISLEVARRGSVVVGSGGALALAVQWPPLGKWSDSDKQRGANIGAWAVGDWTKS